MTSPELFLILFLNFLSNYIFSNKNIYIYFISGNATLIRNIAAALINTN